MKNLLLAITTWLICLSIGILLLASCSPNTSLPEGTTPIKTLPVDTDTPNSPFNKTNQNSEESKSFLPSIIDNVEIDEMDKPVMEVDLPPGVPPQAIQHAMSDLAGRLGVNNNDFIIIKSFQAEFPASDLGCPLHEQQTETEETQVPGLVIVLEYRGDRYTYHATGQKAVLCSQEQ